MEMGNKVNVEGLGSGVVRFIGEHHEKKKLRIGVELEDPTGKSGGKFNGHRCVCCGCVLGLDIHPTCYIVTSEPTPFRGT
jgi:dynactin complex subunit